jgi:exopolysaccharide biosynthesis WecB/TagA/CpsF family protein
VRHALNLFYHTHLPENCRGPEFVNRVCKRAAADGVGIYLYGSTPDVVEAMRTNLVAQFPGLRILGAEPSVFRPLTGEEDAELVERVNASGAGIVFVGLGCPLQERFAHAHRGKFQAVQICVGAAFELHAGVKKEAPVWMQRCSLEWLYRLVQEPRRLARRYFITNTTFLTKVLARLIGINTPLHHLQMSDSHLLR